jgi:hypothetical protein
MQWQNRPQPLLPGYRPGGREGPRMDTFLGLRTLERPAQPEDRVIGMETQVRPRLHPDTRHGRVPVQLEAVFVPGGEIENVID